MTEELKQGLTGKKTAARGVWALVAVALFAAVGFVGYQFIQAVSSSADGIVSNVSPQEALPEIVLGASGGFVAGNNPLLPPADGASSSGEDLVVHAGDFSIAAQETLVRLDVYNQGGFQAGGAYVNMSLIDAASGAVAAQVVGVPVPWQGVLPAGAKRVVYLSVHDAAWQAAVQDRAKAWRVQVQIVGVHDADHDNIDYPQMSRAVVLGQKARLEQAAEPDSVLEQQEEQQWVVHSENEWLPDEPALNENSASAIWEPRLDAPTASDAFVGQTESRR